jgi:hypothetical protein
LKRRWPGFMTTDAKLVRCKCGDPVLKALDEGVWAVVDPWPAERLTEALAIITGRWTYTLTHGHLYRREGYAHGSLVLIQHRCGDPLTFPDPPATDTPTPATDTPPY